jgi:hypothetical protein
VEALNLFTRSATLYLVTHHPQQLLSANPKLDMPALVEEYTRRVDQNIEKVLEYTIKIEMSGLKETKSSYSISDVLGNAKLAIATQNVTDVVSKWPAVRAEA